jgi:LysR family transcriptional activator of nhaA
MLNLKHLYYFYVFGQELSITQAAKRLRLTPPALSNQLKELENFVGYKLYTREKGKIKLTDKGKVVCKYSVKIFSPYEELRSVVQNQWHA